MRSRPRSKSLVQRQGRGLRRNLDRRSTPASIPVSEEERLRGGDKKIEACLYVETLRVAEAEKIGEALSRRFPAAAIGVYRLLCEIRPA